MKLRCKAFGRNTKKALSRPKGVLMVVITALAFAPALVSAVVTAGSGLQAPIEPVRRFAPLAIFALTVASLLFTAGEQALYYTPAEVTFLFAGPYSKRQLLTYKMVTTVLLCLFSSVFFGMMSKVVSPSLLSAFVGSFLLLLFLQVLQMVVGLASSTVGALAWSRGRRLVLAGLVVLVGLAVAPVAREFSGLGPMEALAKVEASPVLGVALMPFRWFVWAFTADRIWPDLLGWSSLGLAVDGILIGLVYALESSYLEAASASSARRFAKFQKLVAGGGSVRSVTRRSTGIFRFRPPAAPWWGGVGPNFWRQMTSALGDPGRIAGLVVMISFIPILMLFIAPRDAQKADSLPYFCLGMIAWMSVALSVLIPYDFRGDVDVIETLKALPIRPDRLALGQLLTPTLVATSAQGVATLVVVVGWGSMGGVVWAFLAFLLPVNLMFYAVENLLFLWYPSRVVAGQFDVMAVGRQMLFMLGKVVGLAVGVGLATLVGAGVFFLVGRAAIPAIVSAWVVMTASSLALIPLVGRAFRDFDVTRDTPA
jgi:hypothetical protein